MCPPKALRSGLLLPDEAAWASDVHPSGPALSAPEEALLLLLLGDDDAVQGQSLSLEERAVGGVLRFDRRRSERACPRTT